MAALITVCGYHVYEDVWTLTVGEDFTYRQEPNCEEDEYAVEKVDCFLAVVNIGACWQELGTLDY